MEISKKIYSLIEIGIKTAVSLLPAPFSAAFNGIWDAIKTNVLDERAEKWKAEVITRLEKVEGDYDSFIKNQAVATFLLKASESAVKTGSDEKRQMLADALVNTYLSNIDEDKTLMFLQLIEKYTILHIRIIKYLHDDYLKQTFSRNYKPPFMVLLKLNFNDVDDAYLKKTIKDLQNDYLVEDFRDNAPVELCGRRFELLTQFGKDFYDFLKPDNNEKD